MYMNYNRYNYFFLSFVLIYECFSKRAQIEGTCLENNVEEGKSCECHMCIGPAISSTVRIFLFQLFLVLLI